MIQSFFSTFILEGVIDVVCWISSFQTKWIKRTLRIIKKNNDTKYLNSIYYLSSPFYVNSSVSKNEDKSN